MRVVIQRCRNASVSVDDDIISSIGKGLCVLVGISKNDTKKDIDYIVRKIVNLRIFEDEAGKRWSHSVKDKNYEVLCVSQFTLYGTLKGNKFDFRQSMAADSSEKFYYDFLSTLKSAYSEDLIKDGKFGAYMQVNIQNDGPFTINLESSKSQSELEDTDQVA